MRAPLGETVPQPVLPAYGAGALSDLMPFFLAPKTSGTASPLPEWMPTHDSSLPRKVLLVIDGLGWHQLKARSALAPTLTAMAERRITSIAPTTTATALTSLATGLAPGEHGIVGYRMHMGTSVMNTLRWGDERGDLRRTHPPRDVQPFAPFLGSRVPVVSKAELSDSGFTEAHLRGADHQGWRMASSIPVIIGQLLAAGEKFVYAYYDGIDKIAHERGFGEFYDAEVVAADALVARVIEHLPPGTTLYVTADHGQVQVGENSIRQPANIMDFVRAQSGEGRFRWLHARRGAENELLESCREAHGECAWVMSRDQIVDEGWFGPVVRPAALRRLGDVALVPFRDVTFEDPADSGPFVLQCRHGSMTAEEVHVPLLVHSV
jgi:predicted AlkP superfamily pyrophosphatase or phosphodiesterase